ncbi:hypothetical protein NZ698_01100 [Chryseobacterium sp. PBS4-4]|uniref:Lipocalin-like domain-containing protein n=1 Tax=Chryseobacterium edaphi TaxID=2976532 RepID=A0ABT2W197_9FLAO|nr:hypothetical protein [Chryseobacterium edaphi]MCU7615780.1 hypothetical protein [Chryseobacterium edaphi]
MKLHRKLTTLLLTIITLMLSAQEYDKGRYTKVLNQLKLSSTQIHNELYTEKKMPNAENSFIIVVPVLQGKLEVDGFSVKNTILITDNEGIIKNKYIDPTEFGSDAIMLQSFTIDTGLYNLNSNVRAFGIIAEYYGSSRPNPYSSSNLSLFYPDGKTLKKVLDGYNLKTFSGEWDTNCSGEFEGDTSVIIVDQAKTNGFANLKIKTESTKTISKELNGECSEDIKSKISYKTLKFNKSTYK